MAIEQHWGLCRLGKTLQKGMCEQCPEEMSFHAQGSKYKESEVIMSIFKEP